MKATEIYARYIESVLTRTQVKARILRRFTDEAERHYAYACLARYGALGAIMRGATPELSAGGLSQDRRATVTRYLHRILQQSPARGGMAHGPGCSFDVAGRFLILHLR